MARYRTIPGHDGPYLATWAVIAWQPVFSRQQYFEVVASSLRYCRAQKDLLLHGFVIMPTHVHLVASSAQPGAFPSLMRDIKRYTSHQVHELLDQDHRRDMLDILLERTPQDQDFALWQQEYHPKAIEGDQMLDQKLRYVHGNPVRAGFVDEPEAWVYSSARNYADRRDCVVEIDRIW